MSFLSRLFLTKPLPVKPNSIQKSVDYVDFTTGSFEFHDGVLADGDAEYARATFQLEGDGSGIVYFDFKHAGKQKIGSFKKDLGSNRTCIFRVSDDEEIGFVDEDGYIYLSRAGMYNSAIKRGFYEKFPDPVFEEVGRLLGNDCSGVFDQAGTHEVIGSYTGKKMAAGAALVVLTYECHTYGLHEFYNYSK